MFSLSLSRFILTPFLTSLSYSFKHATKARLEVSVEIGVWPSETDIMCLAMVCEFRVGFGFDFQCLTVVMGLISGGFWCEFLFNFLWVFVHGGGGCIVTVVDFFFFFFLVCVCVVVVVVYLIFCVVAMSVVNFSLIFCVVLFLWWWIICVVVDFFVLLLWWWIIWLFVYLWVSCGKGGGDGFFLALVVVGFLWQVVVMGGWKGDSEENINRLMVKNEVREIRLYYFIKWYILF